MQDSGLVELGSHSHGHADFRGAPETLRHDLAASLAVLRGQFGIDEPSFAFPFGFGCRGNDGPELAAVAERAGVCCALTTDEQLVRPGDDPMNWGRLAAFENDSAASLAAKLDGWYSLRGAWRRMRRTKIGRRRVLNRTSWTRQTAGKAYARSGHSGLRRTTAGNKVQATAAQGQRRRAADCLRHRPARRPPGRLSLFDQAVVSGTSFVTSVMIGRLCSKEDLGVFYLALTIVYLARGLQEHLVSAPYVVYCQNHSGESRALYMGSSLLHQIALSLAALVALLGVLGLLSFGVGPTGLESAAWILLGCVPFLQLASLFVGWRSPISN